MTPQWDFDFIDRTPSRRKRGPVLALLAVAVLAALWWQQQRSAEAQVMQVAVAQAQQHLREAQLKAQADAKSASAPALDASIWDVAWLDERLRELEACAPGAAQAQTLAYTANPKGLTVTILVGSAQNLDALLACFALQGRPSEWRVRTITAHAALKGELEVVLHAP